MGSAQKIFVPDPVWPGGQHHLGAAGFQADIPTVESLRRFDKRGRVGRGQPRIADRIRDSEGDGNTVGRRRNIGGPDDLQSGAGTQGPRITGAASSSGR